MNGGKTIKRISKVDSNSIALVSPCLLKTSKIRFKIGKMKQMIYIGVFEKEQLIKSNFKIPEQKNGVYVIDNTGCVFNERDSSQHTKTFDLRFKEGE